MFTLLCISIANVIALEKYKGDLKSLDIVFCWQLFTTEESHLVTVPEKYCTLPVIV